LAAKWCLEENKFNIPSSDEQWDSSQDLEQSVVVSCIGVATGKFSADTLRECAGKVQPGKWEPVILEKGISDPAFIDSLGITQDVCVE